MMNKSIPSPCKKDCENRCYGCRNECKKYKVYEMLKKHETNKTILYNTRQENGVKEYKGYRFLRSGIVKGILVDNLKLIDTGKNIRVSLSDDDIDSRYNLDMIIFKIFNGKYDFTDNKIKIIHKDGNYKNCSFDNLESVMA